MRNFSDKVVERIETRFICSNLFPANQAIYDTIWQATDDNIVRFMRVACWITRTTDVNSEYVILIAFCSNECYSERASCYVYMKSTLPFGLTVG
jgi:hypothetical protein